MGGYEKESEKEKEHMIEGRTGNCTEHFLPSSLLPRMLLRTLLLTVMIRYYFIERSELMSSGASRYNYRRARPYIHARLYIHARTPI